MFIDQLLDLYRAGVLRRRAYDSLPLERLLASGEHHRADRRARARSAGRAGVAPKLTTRCISTSCRNTVCSGATWSSRTAACVRRKARGSRRTCRARLARAQMARECLGRELRNGQVLHAGFFLGPRGFYAALRDLDESDRAQIGMRGVAYVNQLYGPDLELRDAAAARRAVREYHDDGHAARRRGVRRAGGWARRQRRGWAVQLRVDGACVAGGAVDSVRARSTRTSGGKTTSNIVWNYAHATIPRHLRDIVVTEYGIADLRGRTDSEVIMRAAERRGLALSG